MRLLGGAMDSPAPQSSINRLASMLPSNRLSVESSKIKRPSSNYAGPDIDTVNLKFIKDFRLPLPSLEDQVRLAAELDAFQASVNMIRDFQQQSLPEIDALMPSILDKTFRGEL